MQQNNARRLVNWGDLPLDIRRSCYRMACSIQESTTYTIPQSGKVKHPIYEAFSASSEGYFANDVFVVTSNAPKRRPAGDVFTSLKISGDTEKVTSLTLEVGGQYLWKTESVTREAVTPLQIEWPIVCMTYSNIFLILTGSPGATVTVTESFRKESFAAIRAMLARSHTYIPRGHNPFNITSVHLTNGMTGFRAQ